MHSLGIQANTSALPPILWDRIPQTAWSLWKDPNTTVIAQQNHPVIIDLLKYNNANIYILMTFLQMQNMLMASMAIK